MQGNAHGFAFLLAAGLVAAQAHGALVIPATHTSHDVIPDANLSDIRLKVDLAVQGGFAVMTFINDSTGLETSAVFNEIVIDTYDDDTSTPVLWDGMILAGSSQGSYTMACSNGLPGFHDYTSDPMPLVELRARCPAPKKGIGPGQTLQVRFRTSLHDGAGIEDYLSFFVGGDDTRNYSIGFHAINASILDGQSASGALAGQVVPEPATMALIVLGGLGLVLRRLL